MATPIDEPYKVKQREAPGNTGARVLFENLGLGPDKTAGAVRTGKLNKKSGRRLATSYAEKGKTL